MKKFYASLLVLIAVASSAVALNFGMNQSDAAVSNGRDCSTNSVIQCGALTHEELMKKYNASSELQALYTHTGINSSNMRNKSMAKNGVVHKDGRVTINGKTVANNVWTVGREPMAGTSEKFAVGDKSYYKRPTTNPNNLLTGDVTALVYVDGNGKFLGAIIKACGNPVFAKPPKPEPKPEYKCVSVSRIQQSDPNKYVFRAKSHAINGAKATGFTVNFGDGNSKRVNVGKTDGNYAFADVPYTYAKPGTYNVKVTAHFSVNGKTVSATAADCAKPVKIEQPPKPPVKDIKVCELATKKIITIKEDQFDAKKHSRNLDDCKEKPKPAAECVELEAERISRTSFELNARASVENGATISSYYFIVRNVQNRDLPSTDPVYFQDTVETTATTASSVADLPNLRPGTYQATVTVRTSEGNKTGPACNDTFTIVAPEAKPVEVCVIETGEIKTIDEKDFDADIHSKDLKDCEEEVCLVEDGTIITINKSEYDEEIHSRDLSDCDEPVVPKTPEEPKVKGEEAPEVIASTGPASVIGGLFGSSALGLGITSYIRSRRALSNLF